MLNGSVGNTPGTGSERVDDKIASNFPENTDEGDRDQDRRKQS
jgi:hypothetical protein